MENIMTSSSSSSSSSSRSRSRSRSSDDASDDPKKDGNDPNNNYRDWERRAKKLWDDHIRDEEKETKQSSELLGLDGKHASSQSERDEREKAERVEKTKRLFETYQRRENETKQILSGLLDDDDRPSSGKGDAEGPPRTIRITRQMFDAGKRVLNICDTCGNGGDDDDDDDGAWDDQIVVTQDLSHLESKYRVNHTAGTTKTTTATMSKSLPSRPHGHERELEREEDERNVYGLVKLFVHNVRNCTIVVRCKIITGTIELTHCRNVRVRVEREATVATIQADLCRRLALEFRDAPSGRNFHDPHHRNPSSPTTALFWGDDANDRIYHAGVSDMKVTLVRDGSEAHADRHDSAMTTTADYLRDGAVPLGNASAEEYQFVTSVVKGALLTEAVIRNGGGGGGMGASSSVGRGTTSGSERELDDARPMTQRELDEERANREKAADMMSKAVRIIEKKSRKKMGPGGGGERGKKTSTLEGIAEDDDDDNDDDDDDEEEEQKEQEEEKGIEHEDDNDDDIVVEEEVYTMSRDQIQRIVGECDRHKSLGNQAFGAGEYAQAVLHYTLALDKAHELPDPKKERGEEEEEEKERVLENRMPSSSSSPLYPRHIILANRSAAFLKLGHHDKAHEDGRHAQRYDPNYVKGIFRTGLALHAMGRYQEAITHLAKARSIEPKNRQIHQALQFAEVRMTQEHRKRMGEG